MTIVKTETGLLMSIVFLLAFLGFMGTITPPEYRVIEPFDFAWLTGGLVAVTGACVVATGLPCAVALAVYSLVSVIGYFVVAVSWIKTLIFIPMSVLLIYLVTRLARGGG
jgi:hypothetical protein